MRGQPLGAAPAPPLQLRDPPGGVAPAQALSAIRDHRSEARNSSAMSSTSAAEARRGASRPRPGSRRGGRSGSAPRSSAGRRGGGGGRGPAAAAVEGAADRIAVEPDLPSLFAPALAQILAVTSRSLLRACRGLRPGGRGRRLRSPTAARISARRVEKSRRWDRRSPRSRRCRCGRAASATPRLGQLVAKLGLVEVAGGLGVVVDRRVVEAGPAAVGSLGRVGDQDVGVELGVAVARGAVAEGGGEEPLPLRTRRPAPRRVQLPCVACSRGRPRRRARGRRDLAAGVSPPSAQSSATDFGAEKVRSKPGTAPLAGLAHPERLAVHRVAAGEHRASSCVGSTSPSRPSSLGRVADPVPPPRPRRSSSPRRLRRPCRCSSPPVRPSFPIVSITGYVREAGPIRRGSGAIPRTARSDGVCVGSRSGATTWLSKKEAPRIRLVAPRGS